MVQASSRPVAPRLMAAREIELLRRVFGSPQAGTAGGSLL